MPATVAIPGRGSQLQTSPDGTTYTTIANLKTVKFGGLDAKLDDITNLGSPSAFMEWLPTVIDSKDVTYDGILDPNNTTIKNLPALLQAQALTYFKVTFPGVSNTITFQGYVVSHVPATIETTKALGFSGKIQITGPVTIT